MYNKCIFVLFLNRLITYMHVVHENSRSLMVNELLYCKCANDYFQVLDEPSMGEKLDVPPEAYVIKTEWFWLSVQKQLRVEEKNYLIDVSFRMNLNDTNACVILKGISVSRKCTTFTEERFTVGHADQWRQEKKKKSQRHG